jgi:hypothetical protein
MRVVFNPFTGKFDYILNEDEFLKIDCSNDPLTGKLDIEPSSGDVALEVSKAIIIKAGQKLYFHGT